MARALTVSDLFKIERFVQMAVSPDGAFGWFVTKRIDLDADSTSFHTYRCVFDSGDVKSYVLHGKGVREIIFSPDGKRIFFVAEGQVFVADPDGANARQLTKGAGGASCLVSSPDGDRVLFTRSVYKDHALQTEMDNGGDAPSLARIYGLSHPKATARTADRLMYRHWDCWTENKYSHLFVVDVSSGEMRDLTPWDADVPPIALDSGHDYDFSPDGKRVAFVMNPDKMVARSTNNSIYVMDLDGMVPGEPHRISDSDGCDTSPRFLSATCLGYCSMLTPGYEADAVRFKVHDLESGETRLYLGDFDRSIESPVVMDDHEVMFAAQDFAHIGLYTLDTMTGRVMQLTSGRTYTHFTALRGYRRVLAVQETLDHPAEIVELSNLIPFEPRTAMGDETTSGETVRLLTRFGKAVDGVEMHKGRCVHFNYQGQTLEGYLVTPPSFDETKKYPLILLIHGGPQGAFLDSFHYRWNVQMFAAQGAIVAFCNPHGSTGYGHDLTRAISCHWSDDCPKAIMAFVDHLIETVPQIDSDRMTAAGASFGGFMINWLLGHTDRFKAFVSHDGIFNTEMSGYITDELWFCDYEFGGTPYDCPDAYIRHSPHRFVKNFKTPTLVVQGEQDFRCFINEGIGLFTALQYMGVESRLLYFPGEGHWVLDPANSAVWYEEVVGWLMKHV